MKLMVLFLLGANLVAPLYTIRWQIELLFKVWKSIAHIDKVKKVKRERFECYIYAKLLIIILCWKLFWSVNKHTYKTEKAVVSGYKFFRTILSNIEEFSKILYNDCLKDQVIFVFNLCRLSEEYLLCETKKDHKNYMDTIMNALYCDTVSPKPNLTNSIANMEFNKLT
jgi:hypothetical protein